MRRCFNGQWSAGSWLLTLRQFLHHRATCPSDPHPCWVLAWFFRNAGLQPIIPVSGFVSRSASPWVGTRDFMTSIPHRTLRVASHWLFVWWMTSVIAFGQEPAPPPSLKLAPSRGVPYLQVAEGFEIDLVVSEPVIEKPLYMQFDARGRLWVVEYRQYPWPAGLKLLSRDNVWRNVYDQIPPPPPHSANSKFRGADRVSIHTDADRDGTFESHRVFVDGLSLATAALPMNGGVYVLNPPYLLFYADADGDDRPDSEIPRVLLSGFGIEDSHSLANSLRRGVDGWIYATQGSTVSAAVVRHGSDNQPLPGEKPVRSLGQNLWRYHPGRHVYEIVAEGGGNAFGVEIDAEGNLFSGHNGGDTRGFHYTHGAFHRKTFDKHGDLSHPFAFGALPAMAHHRPTVSHTRLCGTRRANWTKFGDQWRMSMGRRTAGCEGRFLRFRRSVMKLCWPTWSGPVDLRTRDAGVFLAPAGGPTRLVQSCRHSARTGRLRLHRGLVLRAMQSLPKPRRQNDSRFRPHLPRAMRESSRSATARSRRVEQRPIARNRPGGSEPRGATFGCGTDRGSSLDARNGRQCDRRTAGVASRGGARPVAASSDG